MESIDHTTREDINLPSMDKSRQTDMAFEVSVALQYPGNLIHAQKMYAISMGQLLRVEQQISQLQFHLRERELRLTSSATALVAAVSNAVLQGKESGVAQIRVEVDPRQAAGGLQAEAVGHGAARDGAQQPQGENLRQHRQRLSNAVKLAFVMWLLEFPTGWFFVYFFGVFLYIGGLFDPFIERFQRRPQRVALEQQLNGLRNRQRRDEELIVERSEAERAESVEQARASTDDVKSDKEDLADSDDIATAKGSSSNEDGTATGGLQDSMEESPLSSERVAPAPADENGENVHQPPHWQRFMYQLFVMFCMTLLPWWNPDPRYL